MEQLGSYWTDFDETSYLSFCRKSVEKIQVSLKSEKYNRYFTWRLFIFMTISHWPLHRMRNFSNKICTENQIHILCQITFSEDCALYEITSKNVVEPERPQMTIWRMRVACWISKATCAQARASARAPTPTLRHTRARANVSTRMQSRVRRNR
jgi:hypothetical protein